MPGSPPTRPRLVIPARPIQPQQLALPTTLSRGCSCSMHSRLNSIESATFFFNHPTSICSRPICSYSSAHGVLVLPRGADRRRTTPPPRPRAASSTARSASDARRTGPPARCRPIAPHRRQRHLRLERRAERPTLPCHLLNLLTSSLHCLRLHLIRLSSFRGPPQKGEVL